MRRLIRIYTVCIKYTDFYNKKDIPSIRNAPVQIVEVEESIQYEWI